MDFEEEGNLILFFGCFVNGRLKLPELKPPKSSFKSGRKRPKHS